MPYFLGEKTPIHDPYARGTLVGLGLHHTLGHIWRAALEAVVFGFRHHIEVFEELGHAVRRVIASDGGAQQPRVDADRGRCARPAGRAAAGPPGLVPGRRVCRGGRGRARSPTGIEITRFVRPAAIVEPDPSTAGAYAHAYGLFRETYQRLKPLYPDLQAPQVNAGASVNRT